MRKVFLIKINWFADVYQLIGCFLKSLLVHKKLLIKFLSRTQACVYDIHIHSQRVTGKSDKVLGKVINLNRLTHIKYKYLSSLSIGSCLKHQRNCLRNCHKISYNIRVRNRYGTSRFNLLLKQRYNASVTSKNIAESYSYIIGF